MEDFLYSVSIGVVARIAYELLKNVTYRIIAKIKNTKKNDDQTKDHRS